MIANEKNKQKMIDELYRLHNLSGDKELHKMREKYIYKDINDSEMVRDIYFIKNIRNQYDNKNAFKR